MAETGGASMVETEGRCDSENEINRIKSGEEDEDRISALPDVLIHRILSLLPTTDSVKTMVLSKSWKYQWTRVSVLKFVYNTCIYKGMSIDQFSNFIDKTLNLHDDCSNIDKFVIKMTSCSEKIPNKDPWIRFAVKKHVKELIVFLTINSPYPLPEFLFNNSSLVKLKLLYCDLMPIGKVNWGSVKILRLYLCALQNGGIENVLSGSPMLEYLELHKCKLFDAVVIASKSVKILLLDSFNSSNIEISCPNVERLRISGLIGFTSPKLMNLRSSVYVTFDFFYDYDRNDYNVEDCINLVSQTIMQVQHVEKLDIGPYLMGVLSLYSKDCIEGLPDSLTQRILSFIPSTKEAFKSNFYHRWECKWTDVSILNFVSNEKLVIDSKDIPLHKLYSRLSLWIRFAAKKHVKELILDCDGFNLESWDKYELRYSFFNNPSLVKLKMCTCKFMPNVKVNWESLKSLQLDHSELGNQAIEHVLSGSPLLECLELRYCGFQGALVVASKHLKTILIREFGKNCPLLEISCQNLESLKMRENVGSTCLKLTNVPSSLHATLDFYVLESDDIIPDDCANLVEEIRKQILHVEELEIELNRLKITV
ncbi:FBD-associated F-box protein At2g26860-like [Euphorbia lathyris]|uniref:FBD-associated F-box protein At2g26860-like n=1 Tax=Euphorbia lathyris TaxID=212925 RepID=UPI00331390C9